MPRPPAPHGRASRSPAPQGRTGRPPRTSRAQILTAARQLIERDGWEQLTIRRLAAEIGVGATTLYHHIRDREDLLVQLLNHHIEQLDRPRPPDDPRERVIAAATAMHDALAAWPWAAEVLTTDGFVGLLDESALWMVEEIVAGADDHGCTPEQSVGLFRDIWYYTVGEILVRARTARGQAYGEPPAFREAFDPERAPHLAAVGRRWHALAARDTYPQGLRALVDGLFARADATPSGAGAGAGAGEERPAPHAPR
ncbi:TetR/AcrR family transcriptional regulator [Actinacidiphila yeochonensis]|uniref:TetR/AcrR family transcriptional regulator n=1 Tax=Actinacidiphila yeochonensis TaxID=89050 RepID=UPI00068DE738|nr:TetR/AcrR family transcriptional regulator [Actinacidiphila yeochonensis]